MAANSKKEKKMSKIEQILQLAEARGGQMKRLVENYRAAKSSAHRQKILDTIMASATPQMWVVWYQK